MVTNSFDCCIRFSFESNFVCRIQQIQLLGRDMRGAEHDKLWNQLEAEIHLHRHKTVIRACRGRNNRKKKLPLPEGHVSNMYNYIHENYHSFVLLVHTHFLIGSFFILSLALFNAHANLLIPNTLMLRKCGNFLSNVLSHFFTDLYSIHIVQFFWLFFHDIISSQITNLNWSYYKCTLI